VYAQRQNISKLTNLKGFGSSKVKGFTYTINVLL